MGSADGSAAADAMDSVDGDDAAVPEGIAPDPVPVEPVTEPEPHQTAASHKTPTKMATGRGAEGIAWSPFG